MYNRSKVKLMPILISGIGILLVGGAIFYLSSPANKAEASISLLPKDRSVINLGKTVYAENCASCHGVALEGQADCQFTN